MKEKVYNYTKENGILLSISNIVGIFREAWSEQNEKIYNRGEFSGGSFRSRLICSILSSYLSISFHNYSSSSVEANHKTSFAIPHVLKDMPPSHLHI